MHHAPGAAIHGRPQRWAAIHGRGVGVRGVGGLLDPGARARGEPSSTSPPPPCPSTCTPRPRLYICVLPSLDLQGVVRVWWNLRPKPGRRLGLVGAPPGDSSSGGFFFIAPWRYTDDMEADEKPFRPVELLARRERRAPQFRRREPMASWVEFQALYESCFRVPLDTGRDVGPRRYGQPGGFGAPDGLCPLCNNAAGAEIDRRLMAPGGVARVAREFGFCWSLVFRHLVRHVGPIYSQVGEAVFGLASEDLELGAQVRLEAPGPGPASDRKVFERIGAEMAAMRERVEDQPERRMYGVKYAYCGGSRAMNADGRPRSLVPFNRGQVAAETEGRVIDAINFYDEMMGIRARAITIYDRIMDPEPRILASGEVVEVRPDPKYYRTALAAVSEMRGVVETLGKMSLIAKRLNEGTDGPRRLSPDLQSIIDQIRTGPAKAASPHPPEGDGAEAPAPTDEAAIEASGDEEEDDGLGEVKRAIMDDAQEREDRASMRSVGGQEGE